jgi:hypothetical protein
MALIIRRPILAFAAIGSVLALILFPKIAGADRPLGDHSLIGTYKGVALEIRQDPGSDVEYCQIVVTAVADGRGNISVDNIRRCSLSGTVHDVETGTYSVSPSGVVLFAFPSPDGGRGIVGDNGAIVIVDNFSGDPGDPVLAFHGVVAKVF